MQLFKYSKVLLLVSSAMLGACVAEFSDETIDGDIENIDTDVTEQEAGVFPPVNSFSARGPFATTQQSLGACTVHRPVALASQGITANPVILWGNGTGASPASYSQLLSHLASHGFIVAAANTSNAGNGSQMITCLNNLTTANNTSTSVFFQRVDLARVGASGHSQGGAGTLMAGRDARVTVTAPVQPFINAIPGGGTFLRSSIGQQRGPMLLLSGGQDGIATRATHQQPVFNGTNVRVFWATRNNANHFEPTGDGGDFRLPITAWFRSLLGNDAAAAQVFVGTNGLGLGWTNLTRN